MSKKSVAKGVANRKILAVRVNQLWIEQGEPLFECGVCKKLKVKTCLKQYLTSEGQVRNVYCDLYGRKWHGFSCPDCKRRRRYSDFLEQKKKYEENAAIQVNSNQKFVPKNREDWE